MAKILCNSSNLKSYFGVVVAMLGGQHYVSFLSIHLKKRYSIDDKNVGIYWAIFSIAYMSGCTILPLILKNAPYKLVYFISFACIGIANLFMGTSKLFSIPEEVTYICIGLFLMGTSIVPAYIYCLPQVYLDTQLKYKIVEGVDDKLDGYISD